MLVRQLSLAAGGTALIAATMLPASPASAAEARRCAAPAPPPTGAPLVVDPDTVTAPAGKGRPATRHEQRVLRAGFDNFVACVNAGDHDVAAMLFTPRFIRDYMGQQTYDDVDLILGGLRMSQLRIYAVTAYPDGSFAADTHYLAYGHALVHERSYWWPDQDGFLKVNWVDARPSRVAPHTPRVDVAMGEYFFQLSQARVCAPAGRLALDIRNIGREPHEANLLRLPPGATPPDITDGGLRPEDVVTIGQGGGGGNTLSLTRLKPGAYYLVDFIPAPDGIPHLDHGQWAELIVERHGPSCAGRVD